MVFGYFCSKQRTAYACVISDWSSDVCSSDLRSARPRASAAAARSVAASRGPTARMRRSSSHRPTARARSRAGADQLAPDQHPANLVRPRADVEQLGVAPVTLDRPVLRVTRATERLDRLARHLHRALACEQDRARGV